MTEESSFATRRISLKAFPSARAIEGNLSAPNKSNTATRTSRISPEPSELKIKPMDSTSLVKRISHFAFRFTRCASRPSCLIH